MITRFAAILFCVVMAIVGGIPAGAHHSNVFFEVTKIITLKGKVKEFHWSNPHTQLYILVDDGKGTQIEWRCEGRAPGILSRAGWSKNSFAPGEVIAVEASPARNGSKEALIGRVTKADGTILGNAPQPVE